MVLGLFDDETVGNDEGMEDGEAVSAGAVPLSRVKEIVASIPLVPDCSILMRSFEEG